MGRPQEVKFNHVTTLAEFKKLSPSQLVGVITFVKENHTLYLGTDQYCVVDPGVISQSDEFNTSVQNILNDKLQSAFILKGSVPDKSALDNKSTDPVDPPKKGDVWYITETADNYVWDGSEWIRLAPVEDSIFWKGDINQGSKSKVHSYIYNTKKNFNDAVSDLTGDASSGALSYCIEENNKAIAAFNTVVYSQLAEREYVDTAIKNVIEQSLVWGGDGFDKDS